MNLFSLMTQGVDLASLPDEDQHDPRTPAWEPSPSAGRTAFQVPSDIDQHIIDAAATYDLDPDLLRAVAYAESNFNPKAIGPVTSNGQRAKGLMQIMPGTEKELEIDAMDPRQAVFGGAFYLRQNLDKFDQDAGRALAGYNWGPNRKVFEQPDWYKQLPPETDKYVNRVLDAFEGLKQGNTGTAPANVAEKVTDTGDETARLAARYKAPRQERTYGEAVSDTGAQLVEGVNNILGAVPNLIAPDSGVAQFFKGNADTAQAWQSDAIKQRTASAGAAIDKAGEDGIIAQMVEAAKQYSTDPALAARFVVTNLPSMLPGIGAAKLAQAASLARGATLAQAAATATTVAGGTNALLNAGGARGEAFDDIKATLIKQGMPEAQAIQQALTDSLLPAAVGGVAGFVSGKTGLEGAIVGKAGAKAAVTAGAKSMAAELGGEQLEEVTPKLATNYQASQYDNRSLGKDVGRTIVETAIGSGPGSVYSGVQAGFNTRAAPTVESQPTTPQVPPTAPAAPTDATTATQAVDNIAALLKQTEAQLDGTATQATPVQPGSQAADTGTTTVAQGPEGAAGGLAVTGETAATGQSESAQSLSVPEKGSAQNLSTESHRTPEQVAYARAAAQFNALLPQLNAAKAAGNTVEAERIAMQMQEFDIAMKLAEHRQFQQGQKKAEAERAATRATELDAKDVGARLRPSQFPDGDIYVEKQANGSWRGTGAMYEGKTLTSAELGGRAMVDMPAATGIAAEMAALKARGQTQQPAQQAQPAQQQQAKPRTKPQPLLTKAEAAMLGDFERMYQADVKGEIKTRLGLMPARQDEATAPAEKRKPSELLAAIKKAGGIKSTNAGDLMGGNAAEANRILPGLFKKDGMNMDLLVPFLKDRGYLTQADEDSIKDNGGVNKLAEILQAELSGDRAQTVDSTAGFEADADNAMRSQLDEKAFALGLPMKVTNEMSTERLNGVINRIERKLGRPVNTDFATRKMSRTEAMAERQAILMADRVERARAQYDADIQAFAEADDAVQDAALDVFTDENGDVVIVNERDADAELAARTLNGSWSDQNGQENATTQDSRTSTDTRKDRSPVARGSDQGTQADQGNGTEAGAGQEGLKRSVAPAARYEVGNSLNRAQRREVLKSLTDVYVAKGAPKEFKGQGRDGNERTGYAYSPELFEKSDITGAMVRYYVTLPDGRIAHPTELFPDYTDGDIKSEMERRANAEKREAENIKSLEERVARHTKPTKQAAAISFYQRNPSVQDDLSGGPALAFMEKDGGFYATTVDDVGTISRMEKLGWTDTSKALNTYTPAEVTARQQATAQAEAATKRAEDAAARAEAAAKQASEIAQRSVAAADTFELGQSAEDNLSGQGGLFSTRQETEKAENYEAETGFAPYVEVGNLSIDVGIGAAPEIKRSVKAPYEPGKVTTRKKEVIDPVTGEKKTVVVSSSERFNDPATGLPLNQDGTVTLYFPTTNANAREVARTKKLSAPAGTSRIYLTNESSGGKVLAEPGSIENEMDGANVLVTINPSLLHFVEDYETGRKDFFIPLTEGAAFKAKMTRLFTLDAPRTRAISKDTKLTDIEARIASSVEAYQAMTPAQRKVRLREARNLLREQHNVGTLLSVNGKLEKTNTGGYGLNDYDGQDVKSLGLGLASAQKINEQNLSTCPRSAICEGLCLGETSGQNLLYGGDGSFKSGPRMSQYLKTEAMIMHPEEFAIVLHAEIATLSKHATRDDYKASVRLNVTSDFRPQTFKGIINAFPEVMFYDYTKLPTKVLGPNHHLTYSSTGATQVVNGQTVFNKESNWNKMVDVLRRGDNVAMAFTDRNEMPAYVVDEATGEKFQVWNGDNYDARFLDPKPGEAGNEFGKGMIIGLTNKDRTTAPENAAREYNGFFINYNPDVDGDTVTIPNQSAPERKVINIAPRKPSVAAPKAVPTTPVADIRQAITKAYGNLLTRLEGKGLVSLTQTEEEAIAAAAQARADQNGGDVEAIKESLRKSVLASVAPQTESANFKAWFGDSKVVDADGKPLVVYHGTAADFNEFDIAKSSQSNRFGPGFYFTGDKRTFDTYGERDGGNVMPVYLSIQNPQIGSELTQKQIEAFFSVLRDKVFPNGYDATEDHVRFKERALENPSRAFGTLLSAQSAYISQADWLRGMDAIGVDGIVREVYGQPEYVAFRPTQIKSAIGNNGDFDPANPDIRRSADGNLEGFFDPATGKSFLIADNLTAESAPATLMHEVGIHMAADGKLEPLFQRAGNLLKMARGNAFIQRVQSRMDESGETSNEEAAAYIVTEYERDRTNAPASVGKWIKDFIADVRAWLFSKGVLLKADQLTVADIAAVARANASRMAKGKGWVGSAQNDGAFRFGNTEDQRSKDIATVADAFSGDGIELEAAQYTDDSVTIWVSSDPDSVMTLYTQPSFNGVWRVNSQDARGRYERVNKGNAGQRMYQALFAWAHNNGLQVDPENSLSYVNEIRRTSAMLSSGLRFGTFKHLLSASEYQGVEGYDPDNFDQSVDALTQAELTQVSRRIGTNDISGFSIDPRSGTVYADERMADVLRESSSAQSVDSDSQWQQSGNVSAEDRGGRTGGRLAGGSGDAVRQMDARHDDGAVQVDVTGRAGNTPSLGGGTTVSQTPVSDSELARYLASTRGGFEAHGVGVSTLKRALITRDFAGETDLPGLLYSVAGETDIRRSVRGGGQGNGQAQQNLALNTPSPDWMLPASTKTDALVYEIQDQKVDLKRTQEAIKAAGRTITEPFDARLAETLMPGRVAYRTETFLKTEVAPLMEAMAKNNVTQNELSDYLLARHAPERNAQIAKVNPEMPDGGAGTNSAGVLMTTQAAQDHIAALTTGKRMVLQLLANKIDAITANTRDLLVREGLEKQSTMDAWTGAYKHYVPLFKDEAVESPAHPIGSGMSVTGSASKRAMGSEGEVTNMVAHILMQRESAITRAEKNRVAMSLYGLALSNPNQEVWTTIRPNMRADKIGAELAAMGVDPVEAEQGMQGVPTIRTINAVTGLVQETPNPMYKRLENALVVKVDGEDRVILFNAKNADAMRMARALKNQDGLTNFDLAGSMVGTATRYFASINTQYNPAFGMVNVVRDIGGALVNLTTTGIADKKAQVFGNIHAAMKGIARDVRGDQARTPWSDLWVQFQEDGGRTGYRDLFIDPFKRAEAVQKDLDAMQRDGTASAGRVAHSILDLLDDFNTTLENGVRLSAYKAALDKGMSRPAAAKLARELTVDFNRKGRTGREMGPLYAFFNASVQGTARTVESLKGPAGKKIIAGGLMLGVIQSLLLAWADFDDDEPPEFVKARAFIIPMGDKKYIAIPLQFGLNALPNTGRVITDLLLTGGKDAGKKTFNAIGEIMGSFNPLGGGNIFTAHGLLTTVAPTVADPLIDLATNTNFAGTPIGRDRADWDTRPGAKLARESTQRSLTGQAYIGISKAINAMSGGNEFKKGLASPTPEQVQYVFTTAGGGLYRELEKTLNIAGLKADGMEIKSRMIPLGGRFAGEADDQDTQRSRYFKNSERLAALEAELKGFEKADNKAEIKRIETERKDEVALLSDYKSIRRDITELNKLATENIDDVEQLKELDTERLKLMRELNDSVRKLEKRSELFKRD